ncbi:MAG TPA: TPM domain-containing protein [Mucilaginibacter sp.]|nr:TPM domain-containing protein [Mucilaginibacter sp.]
MKRLLILCLIIFPCVLHAQGKKIDPSILPSQSSKLVNDYTQTLSPKEIESLETKLEKFQSRQTAQMAIVILESIGDNDIMQYGTALGKAWGIGYKGVNNGVLILVARNDRKVAIVTGKGIEKTLTNEICNRFIQTDLLPHFKNGQFFPGLDLCVNDLMKFITDRQKR